MEEIAEIKELKDKILKLEKELEDEIKHNNFIMSFLGYPGVTEEQAIWVLQLTLKYPELTYIKVNPGGSICVGTPRHPFKSFDFYISPSKTVSYVMRLFDREETFACNGISPAEEDYEKFKNLAN